MSAIVNRIRRGDRLFVGGAGLIAIYFALQLARLA